MCAAEAEEAVAKEAAACQPCPTLRDTAGSRSRGGMRNFSVWVLKFCLDKPGFGAGVLDFIRKFRIILELTGTTKSLSAQA